MPRSVKAARSPPCSPRPGADSGGGVGGAGGLGAGGVGAANGGGGGTGGVGGTAAVTANAGTTAGGIALSVTADGGVGGAGGSGGFTASTSAGSGGSGGAAGNASAEIAASVEGATAVFVSATGGTGGAGAPAVAFGSARGGSGGRGGVGGGASANVLTGGKVLSTGSGEGTAGVLAQANGGSGGAGGTAGAIVGQAGGGGFGGAGGAASVTVEGSVATSGDYTHGLLAQSVGGGGGDGASASGIFAGGGQGLWGGDGGPVSVISAEEGALVGVSGQGAHALLAQSVGGGGGSGGDALSVSIGTGFGVAIGGNGGLGGDGDTVTATLAGGVFASTGSKAGGGLLLQSIGGAGGAGGSATADGTGVLELAIGGDADGGGAGGDVTIDSAAVVSTYGDHATGIETQSIGGGGGKGGAAATFGVNIVPINVSVGGRGGTGGPAANSKITNAMQVSTFGPDAPAMRAQSIGGGGGHGGAAVATSIGFSPDPEIPSISVSVAVGGAGGSGNVGGQASVSNSGLAMTAGHGSTAVVAQSVGGGGGAGGDSTAASYTYGAGDTNISIAVGIGGTGGSGGAGGAAGVDNAGLVFTLGQDAPGVLAQSVGGGGGTGGGGDAKASSVAGETLSLGMSIGVGGSGGTGGDGGASTLTNAGGIVTSGDGSDGLFGQSVGGGGGIGGGGVGKANGGELAIGVAVGGSGGAGGDGAGVSVSNAGGVVTIGTDSAGMTAQSIGGGGGRGGKGGATTGGAAQNTASSLAGSVANGLNIGKTVTTVGDGVSLVGDGKLGDVTNLGDLGKIAGDEPDGGDGADGEADNVRLSVAVGGSGGAAGAGGTVTAENTGAIATSGALADGVFAHSVGGGGGIGGAASSSTGSGSDVSGALSIGGSGGAGGAGGVVTLTQVAGATVETRGVSAFGLVAQSVGGGGGKAAIAGAKGGAADDLSIAVGGAASVSGDGGAVTAKVGGIVETKGKHAIGVLAQSVGGGGGIAKTISTDQTGDQSNNPENDEADGFDISLSFGANGAGGGDGGTVEVETTGAEIVTQGRNAHGVLAQSIGGGGGLGVGGQAEGTNVFLAGSGGPGGGGGNVSASLTNSNILAAGDGAVGVWAMSVGGGGGIGGDIASSVTPLQIPGGSGGDGDGGAVSVALAGTSITVSGENANGIIASSVAGGGGTVATGGGLMSGSAGGGGTAGTVTVALTDSASVSAEGVGSNGIWAQTTDGASVGDSVAITIDGTSAVTGGIQGYAVLIEGGTGDTLANAGTITGGTDGYAIFAVTGGLAITNTGSITGAISNPGGSGSLLNGRRGLIASADEIDLGGGRLENRGTLAIGAAGQVDRTTLRADLTQTATGVLRADLDAEGDGIDLLRVRGAAELDGRIEIDAISLAKGSFTLLEARDGLTHVTGVAADPTLIFDYQTTQENGALTVAVDADFREDDQAAGTRRDLARHLRRAWDAGTPGFGSGFAAMAGVATEADYAGALDAIAGRSAAAAAAARVEGSQRFAKAVMSCPTFEGTTALLREGNCAWGRFIGSSLDQDGTTDAPGFDWKATTTLLGGQREIAPDWFLAGAIGYENSWQTGDDGARVDGDTGLAVLGVKRQTGPLLLAAAADLAFGTIDIDRRVSVGDDMATTGASTDTFSAGLHLRAAYQIPRGDWYLQPVLDLDAAYVRVGGYTEDGSDGYDRRVEDSEDLVFAATPSLRAGRRLDLAGGTVLNLYAMAGASFSTQDEWTTTVRLDDVPAEGDFIARLDAPAALGRLTLGADVMTAGPVTVSVLCDTSFGSNQNTRGAAARLSWRF